MLIIRKTDDDDDDDGDDDDDDLKRGVCPQTDHKSIGKAEQPNKKIQGRLLYLHVRGLNVLCELMRGSQAIWLW